MFRLDRQRRLRLEFQFRKHIKGRRAHAHADAPRPCLAKFSGAGIPVINLGNIATGPVEEDHANVRTQTAPDRISHIKRPVGGNQAATERCTVQSEIDDTSEQIAPGVLHRDYGNIRVCRPGRRDDIRIHLARMRADGAVFHPEPPVEAHPFLPAKAAADTGLHGRLAGL